MVAISVQGDFEGLRRHLEKLQADINKAAVRALNSSAFRVAREAGTEIAGRVDNPVAFTKKPLVVASKATDTDLTAVVRIKDIQARYLGPVISGGARPLKRSEQRFMGRAFVPGRGIALNANGNVPKATLLALLKAVGTGGKGTFKSMPVFVGKPGRLPAGVWGKKGRELVPLLIFVEGTPSYRRQIDFRSIAESSASRIVADEFGRAMAAAVAGSE